MTVLMVPEDKEAWPSLGAQVCDFIEQNLVFGPGDLRGLPAKLDDEKRALIWRMYEVYPQKHKLAGRRRFKRVGISIAKGLAKTEFAAWIAACELHYAAPVRCIGWDDDGNPIGGPVNDPYIPMVAFTEEQSDELAYGALRVILEESEIKDDFDIGLERIMRLRGDGKAVSLSNSPSARDGARTTFSICDETHWFTSPKLVKAHQTMMANLPKRKAADAWMLEITTAFEPGAKSVAEGTMDYACAVRDGRIKDSRLFFFHRQASDKHDLTTKKGARAAVEEASGPAKSWRDIDSIVALLEDPTTDRSFWERVWCNRIVHSSSKAFDPIRWGQLAAKDRPEILGPIVLGFDGSQRDDATGLVATDVPSGYQWVIGAWEHPINAKDWRVPIDEVDAAIEQTFAEYDVWRLYADPPYWQDMVAKWVGQYGKERVIEWWTNRRKPTTYALENYSSAINAGTIAHDGNEVMARHIANAHKREINQRDETGKRMWLIEKDRPDSQNKIDLAMAGVLSWEARSDAIAAGVLESENLWETMGMTFAHA
jgi:hypothetical protein